MIRPNDIGGLDFGPIDTYDDGQPFHHEWEARVFTMVVLLSAKGLLTSDEMRSTMEKLPPEQYYAMSYYERWLCALKSILKSKGVI